MATGRGQRGQEATAGDKERPAAVFGQLQSNIAHNFNNVLIINLKVQYASLIVQRARDQ